MPKIKGTAAKPTPLWKGPQVDGVTYSLLCRFLSCRERFRLRVVEGLVPRQKFEPDRDWGSLWHTCEECCGGDPRSNSWKLALERDVGALAARYPLQRDDIALARDVCRLMFEIYLDWQAERAEDDGDRRTLLSERVFDVPYRLLSGRTVRLRGKWDRVELVEGLKMHGATNKDLDGVWVTDHKTKGQIDEGRIERQLRYDLQTMLYLVALETVRTDPKNFLGADVRGPGKPYGVFNVPIVGVRYNVIRRPAHRQGKAESRSDFLKRMAKVVANNPEHFFHRWDVVVSTEDVRRFCRETLDAILENLCNWWTWVSGEYATADNVWGNWHWRSPFGVYDPLAHGRETEYDGFLENGSLVGLERTDNLFPELSD